MDLTTHALERAKQLYQVQGIAEKDLQQAISDQQTAEGALKAGRDAVRVFGKSEAEIDAHRRQPGKIDPVLVVPVRSPAGSRRAWRSPDYWSSPAIRPRPTPSPMS